MWIIGIVLTYLVVLSIRDYRERQVPLLWLAAGMVILPGIGIYRCAQGEMQCIEMIVGVVPGALLLLVAWISGKAGYADGVVLIELGLCMGYRESIWIFALSLLLLSALSGILLILKRVCKDTQMPYLPFLTIVFLIRQF